MPFPSWESIIQFGMIYPISNTRTHIFYNNLNQMRPTKYPFLDNRIIDLALRMPTSHRYKRNVVEATLSDLNPSLASIPHSGHGLPLYYPYYIKHYFSRATGLWEKIMGKRSSKEINDSIGGGGSWPNHGTLIRQHKSVKKYMEKNENQIRSSPYLDYNAAKECYITHLNGESRAKQLYGLIGVLESPLELDDK